CFTGGDMRIVDDEGRLRDEARRVWDSGVIMDIGHGAGSFSFETAEALMAAGYRPDVISSDIHQLSILGPMFDLPTCLGKFMALGMSFAEVVQAATARPAQVMGLQGEVGTLKPGALADVALFRIERGAFTFYDIHMNPRAGKELVRNTLTIVDGRALPVTADGPQAPWIELSEAQHALIERGHTPTALAARSACGC
ncbi:MAG: amidohydrolase family protein, partial [Geminicoccaceae bacterium]